MIFCFFWDEIEKGAGGGALFCTLGHSKFSAPIQGPSLWGEIIRENQNYTLSPNETQIDWENIYWDFWRKVERALLYGSTTLFIIYAM